MAKAKGGAPSDVTVVVLDRPRHTQLVREVRAAGARIKFISDCDVAGAIMAARPESGVDLMLGIGGTPEGIIAAAALCSLGGEIQARLAPSTGAERDRARALGLDLDGVLTTRDLIASDDVFFCATGVTDGELLPGVRYGHGHIDTSSLIMRGKSGSIREVHSTRRLDRLNAYAIVDYS